jgi:biopolymer transport protein ExbD
MKLSRLRSTPRGRIEIIPMIDVMFFLLATFMIASLSLQKLNAVAIKLPQGQAAEKRMDDLITITIQKDGQFLLNKTPVTMEALKSTLLGMVNGQHKNIVIAADKDAHHGDVVKAMLAARSVGVNDFSIAVDNE